MTTPREVARALMEEPVGRIHFVCGPTSIVGADYRIIARNVENGTLRLRRLNARAPYSAYYSYRRTRSWVANAFYFKTSFDPSQINGKALLVHEATHAIQDYRRVPMPVIDAECAAFLAQAICHRLYGSNFTEASLRLRDPSELDDPDRNDLLETLEAITDRLLNKPAPRVVTSDEYAVLRERMCRHPSYARHVTDHSHFDGF